VHIVGRGVQKSERVSLLAVDPELRDAIPPEVVDVARRALHVELVARPPGPLELELESAEKCLGVLVAEGLLTRTVELGGSHSVEPLGPGDLLRPWQEDAVSFVQTTFSVLTPTRLAVLDGAFVRRALHFPPVVECLIERATRRSRFMAVSAAIDGLVGVHRRVLALMWTLAERWGTIENGEVFLPIELQHEHLAGLVAARRPSVSAALGRLRSEGRLERVRGGWILRGDPLERDVD
jgi:CRP/FNR family transcriptional regulator, cyclic AMP receptor protein